METGTDPRHLPVKFPDTFLFFFGGVGKGLRQGFSVTLEAVLELAFVDLAGLELREVHLPLPLEFWN